MELAASIVLFAAASLIVVCAVFMLRLERMPWRSEKRVLGMTLPKLGESGSIVEADMRRLSEQGITTPYQTWLSNEQASLLLEKRSGPGPWASMHPCPRMHAVPV